MKNSWEKRILPYETEAEMDGKDQHLPKWSGFDDDTEHITDPSHFSVFQSPHASVVHFVSSNYRGK